MKIIGYIDAKKFCHTNILEKPILWWILTESKKVKFIDEIFVFTENDELAQIAYKCDCRVVSCSIEQIFDLKTFQGINVWSKLRNPLQSIKDVLLSKCGIVGDLLIFLDSHSCLITAELIEDMFVKLMEDPFSSDIFPVTKNDSYLLLKDKESKHFCPLLFQPGMDRQRQPKLYQIGKTRIHHTLRPFKIRQLYHEVEKEYILEVYNKEHVELAEYYLSLRLEGKIHIPYEV